MTDQEQLMQRAAQVEAALKERYGNEVALNMIASMTRLGGVPNLDQILRRDDAVDVVGQLGRTALSDDQSGESDKAWRELRSREREEHRKYKGR